MSHQPVTIDEVREYARTWKDRLYLSAWTLVVRVARLEDDRGGQCLAVPDYWEAVIEVDLSRINWLEADWKHVILHELLHIAFSRIDAVTDEIIGLLDEDTGQSMGRLFNMEQEAAIDLMARVLRDAEKATSTNPEEVAT